MCKPMSWIEYDGNVYFLTAKDLRTKEGRELKKYLGSAYKEDVVGHGAIDHFYGLKGQGVHHEVNDFTDPARFPQQIVAAIKAGAFEGMFICPQILTAPALDEYGKIRDATRAEYEKIEDAAWAEYEKITAPAWAEYEKITGAAWAECGKIRDAALAEYEKITAPALAEYEKIRGAAFWRIARNPENRIDAWK